MTCLQGIALLQDGAIDFSMDLETGKVQKGCLLLAENDCCQEASMLSTSWRVMLRPLPQGRTSHLRSRGCKESLKNDVCDTLAGEHIAAHHSCPWPRAKQTAGRDADLNWLQAALVEGDILRHHAAQGVDDG